MSDACVIEHRRPKKVYSNLKSVLKRSILNKEFEPGQLIGTEIDLAKQNGISRMSVRKAVSDLIKEGLVERRPGVGVFVREKGVPISEIQISVPTLEWGRCVQYIHGIKSSPLAKGIRFQICDAHLNLDQELEFICHLHKSSIKGAIIVSFHNPKQSEILFELKSKNFPFVLIDEHLKDILINSVVTDNYDGGYQASTELLKAGHKNVGYVGISPAQDERFEGFRDAVIDQGIPFNRKFVKKIQTTDISPEIIGELLRTVTKELIENTERPSAIFFGCDGFAAIGYQVIKAHGFKIPDDISVIGFDDDKIAALLDPPLTTISQRFDKIGQKALELLLNSVHQYEENKVITEFKQERIEVKLVSRNSIAKM